MLTLSKYNQSDKISDGWLILFSYKYKIILPIGKKAPFSSNEVEIFCLKYFFLAPSFGDC